MARARAMLLLKIIISLWYTFVTYCANSASFSLIASFIKTWRVENTGNDAWPQGCRLLHTGGERLGAIEASEPLSCLLPHTQLDVSMQMVAPLQQGLFSSKWRMSTMEGHFFGG